MDIDDIIVSTRADTAPDIIFIQFSQATNTGAKKKNKLFIIPLVCMCAGASATYKQSISASCVSNKRVLYFYFYVFEKPFRAV